MRRIIIVLAENRVRKIDAASVLDDSRLSYCARRRGLAMRAEMPVSPVEPRSDQRRQSLGARGGADRHSFPIHRELGYGQTAPDGSVWQEVFAVIMAFIDSAPNQYSAAVSRTFVEQSHPE